MYELRILNPALDDLKRIGKAVVRRILTRLEWLTSNFEDISPESLAGDLRTFYKFRIGDYRVIYQILPDEHLILIDAVGHRREIYRNR